VKVTQFAFSDINQKLTQSRPITLPETYRPVALPPPFLRLPHHRQPQASFPTAGGGLAVERERAHRGTLRQAVLPVPEAVLENHPVLPHGDRPQPGRPRPRPAPQAGWQARAGAVRDLLPLLPLQQLPHRLPGLLACVHTTEF